MVKSKPAQARALAFGVGKIGSDLPVTEATFLGISYNGDEGIAEGSMALSLSFNRTIFSVEGQVPRVDVEAVAGTRDDSGLILGTGWNDELVLSPMRGPSADMIVYMSVPKLAALINETDGGHITIKALPAADGNVLSDILSHVHLPVSFRNVSVIDRVAAAEAAWAFDSQVALDIQSATALASIDVSTILPSSPLGFDLVIPKISVAVAHDAIDQTECPVVARSVVSASSARTGMESM